VDARQICEGIRTRNSPEVDFIESLEAAQSFLFRVVKPGDLVITLGAGDVWTVAPEFVKRLRENPKGTAAPRQRAARPREGSIVDQKGWMDWVQRIRAQVRMDAPMHGRTSWRIGGTADALVVPEDLEALQELVSRGNAENIPIRVVGGGTNLLVSDRGVEGIVVSLGKGFDEIKVVSRDTAGGVIYAGAGAQVGELLRRAAEADLGGLEFLAGVPGTVGGALVMNSGSATEFIGDAAVSVEVVDGEGRFWLVSGPEIEFGYRRTAYPVAGAIVGGSFRVRNRPRKEVMQDIRRRVRDRRETQPLTRPTAGSTFKNPAGESAARLIDEAGLKGFRVGDAEVSDVHANFIVNRGRATAADVEQLVTEIQRRVGTDLELEIHRLGRPKDDT
jgi:UDP-N-acetylmuramate dehydrogenase